MVRTFTGNRPPRNEMDEQKDTQLSELGLNDFRPMPRNLFVRGAEQDQLSGTDDDERTPIGSTKPARTTELEERTRVLEMEMGKILARLILDDPLIPLLNRDAQPTAMVATHNSPALSNVVIPTKPKGSGKLNSEPSSSKHGSEPSSSKHGEELMRKNADLERQFRDVQKSIDELKSPRSVSFILSEDFQSSKRRADDKQSKSNEQPPSREEKKKQKVSEQWGKPVEFPKYANYIPLTLPRSQILAQIQHWIRRPPPRLYDSPRADKSKHCDYHRVYGYNTKDCQHLKDELEFLARNGKLEGYVQKLHTKQPTQNHFVQGYDRPQGQRPLKRPFEEVEWENAPITFRPVDYKRAEGEPDIMMPHADLFVATVHIGNHNINKVFIDTGSSLNILYWSCFQKMQLNPSLLQKYEGPVYGFDNQLVPVEGVITLPIYVGSEPRFRMASVDFLVVKMESAFNAILGRATLCELKAVISQPHLYMKFPTPQGVQLLLDDQEKTAFYVGDAIYCYVMMPFGLKNAGATYQKLVQIIFKLQIGKNIEVYVDDMIVTNVRAEDHINDLSEMFQNLRRAQMKLNPLKCTFVVELGKFLRYVVSKKGIEVNPEKVLVVQQMEPPKTVKDVQRLTSRVAALHRFIARGEFIPEPGVTEEAVSSVLLREENKNQKPICYVSKVLQGAEQNYPLAEKTAFALKPELSGRLIEWSVELSEYDLKFQPRTTIKGQAIADFLVECISVTEEEKAPEHPVWVLYVDGAANIEGLEYEALIYGLKLASELKDLFPSKSTKYQEQITTEQASCQSWPPRRTLTMVFKIGPVIEPIYSLVLGLAGPTGSTDRPADFSVEKQISSNSPVAPSVGHDGEGLWWWVKNVRQWCHPAWNNLPDGFVGPSGRDGRNEFSGFGWANRPNEPGYQPSPFHALGGGRTGWSGLGFKTLTLTLKDQQLSRCWTPQATPISQSSVREMLSSLSSPWPFAQWGVDLLGPFIKGKGGCTYLIVAVDYFTKWIEAKPLSTTIKKKIEEFLFNSILYRFGIPKRIIADNGPQVRVAALRSFCNDYGIELALTSVYTPQSNGQAESANKIVLRGLKTRVLAAHSNWVDEFNKVLWFCRTTPSSATGETPFSLAYGAEAVILVEVGLPFDRADRHSDDHNEQLLRENLHLVEKVRKMARIRNMAHQSRVAKFYNKRV
ncbi:hypothetical protein SLEP1_g14200 [Rubroshorea leprosula]|uniref:RNA-directed DNA polymerase n=1 Tax=Rubroshorea leprosula TaxID=152421 RepID=A0AAV5ITS2_9ROSI|nr:hypothetical protein SLEP1_g14200 [Rubroshorea leprosula]